MITLPYEIGVRDFYESKKFLRVFIKSYGGGYALYAQRMVRDFEGKERTSGLEFKIEGSEFNRLFEYRMPTVDVSWKDGGFLITFDIYHGDMDWRTGCMKVKMSP